MGLYIALVVVVLLALFWWMSQPETMAVSPWSQFMRPRRKSAADQARADANVAHINAQKKERLRIKKCRAAVRHSGGSINQSIDMCK